MTDPYAVLRGKRFGVRLMASFDLLFPIAFISLGRFLAWCPQWLTKASDEDRELMRTIVDEDLTTTYDRMKADPHLARLLTIEERKLAISEYMAEHYGFGIPDDEELDRLFDELAGVDAEEQQWPTKALR